MVTKEELEGFRRDRYLARSWALLTAEKGWWKPVLVCTLASLVPVVGWIGVLGYVYEWGRLTAWEANTAPRRKGVKVGRCLRSGGRVFVVLVVWGLVVWAIGEVLSWLPLLGGLLSFVWYVFSFFLDVVAVVAALRATIYQKVMAGFYISRCVEMGLHDVGGLLRSEGIRILGALVGCVVAGIVVGGAMLDSSEQIMQVVEYYGGYAMYYADSVETLAGIALVAMASVVVQIWPALVALWPVLSLVGVLFCMISTTSVALWMRQFDVPAWGREEDPLPPTKGDPRDGEPFGGAGAGEPFGASARRAQRRAGASGEPRQPDPVPAEVVREWSVDDEDEAGETGAAGGETGAGSAGETDAAAGTGAGGETGAAAGAQRAPRGTVDAQMEAEAVAAAAAAVAAEEAARAAQAADAAAAAASAEGAEAEGDAELVQPAAPDPGEATPVSEQAPRTGAIPMPAAAPEVVEAATVGDVAEPAEPEPEAAETPVPAANAAEPEPEVAEAPEAPASEPGPEAPAGE